MAPVAHDFVVFVGESSSKTRVYEPNSILQWLKFKFGLPVMIVFGLSVLDMLSGAGKNSKA